MDTHHIHHGHTQGDNGLGWTDRRPGWSAQSIRWINRTISAGLLTGATIMGVQFGLDAPTVSPVSPSAIAAQAAVLSGGNDEAHALPVRHGDDHRQGRGRR